VNQAGSVFATHAMLTPDPPRMATPLVRGGLAPWQERRAKELMSTHLGREISLAFVAGECGLSVSHFARSFKQCTGKPPHRWLLENRVEKAKELLINAELPLAEIALECGFSDQSHFTRVFSRIAGTSPGTWQRLRPSRRAAAGRFGSRQEQPAGAGTGMTERDANV
jgi:AraC family transcriptional regulator